jgi:hypothetical protein
MIKTYSSTNDIAIKDTLVTLGQPRDIAKATVTWMHTHPTDHTISPRNGGPAIIAQKVGPFITLAWNA